jgi:hypothetical protein
VYTYSTSSIIAKESGAVKASYKLPDRFLRNPNDILIGFAPEEILHVLQGNPGNFIEGFVLMAYRIGARDSQSSYLK